MHFFFFLSKAENSLIESKLQIYGPRRNNIKLSTDTLQPHKLKSPNKPKLENPRLLKLFEKIRSSLCAAP